MKHAVVKLESVSAYSQSRPYAHLIPRKDKEGPDDFEKRTWREKCHYDDKERLFIPGMSLKFAIDETAKFLGQKIPGKGASTYSKHFRSGVLVLDNAPIGIKKSEVEPEWLFMNADGVRGSGKRVWRCYPLIREWQTTISFHIGDDTITKPVFEEHLEEAGRFIGIGRFAPRSGGFKGRFRVAAIDWQ